jgi:ABC-type transport system substrate-binding protein
MQEKRVIWTVFLAALIALSSITAPFAFIYPDGSEDDNFEIFGPRIERLVIKKYASLDAELAALQNGEIDITDSALTKSQIDMLSTDPNVGLASNGGEAFYYSINFNLNNNSYRGNPPDPVYPNPVYPNPMSEVALRQACAYLIDRTALYNGPWQGMYEPIYTPIPAYMKYWIHPEIKPGGVLENLTYPANVAKAAEVLDNGGFPMGSDGYRYWDRNRNGVKDAGEEFSLKFYARSDVLRKSAADMLTTGFLDSQIRIPHNRMQAIEPSIIYVKKNYHIYTSGWIYIGPDPDYLYDLYHWDNYWQSSEMPPNFGSVSIDDPIMQTQLITIATSLNQTEALQACLAFQERFASTVSEIPLASPSGIKAYNKWYTGGNDGILTTPDDGENRYRGQSLMDIVNEGGQGIDSIFTMLNAYPREFQYGDGHMTLRFGWKLTDMMFQTINPLTSLWYWETQISDLMCERPFGRDPTAQGPYEVPSLVENWSLGVWTDATDGHQKSKITMTITPDVVWSDGTPFTIDDLIYNMIGMPAELKDKDWASWTFYPRCSLPLNLVGAYKLDKYTAEFLATTQTRSLSAILDYPILPKHLWQPFIATHNASEIESDLSVAHPEMLVGTGPFIFVENNSSALVMTRNPLYRQRMNTVTIHYEQSNGNKFVEGITIAALPPSIQLRPFKIQSSWIFPASVRLTVPVTNLDVDDSCIIHEKAELLRHNGSIQTLVDVDKSLASFQVDVESFDVYNLENGQHTIRVTVEVTGGVLYDYVTANLQSELWQSILGPKTVTKSFWVTVLADIDENGTVDILDIVLIATNFGKSIGETGFKSEGDLNMDGTVDIFDIVNVAINFGWHY